MVAADAPELAICPRGTALSSQVDEAQAAGGAHKHIARHAKCATMDESSTGRLVRTVERRCENG